MLQREGPGKRTRRPLGDWPAIDVSQARDAARSLRDGASNEVAADAGETLGVLLERYRRVRLARLRSGAAIYRSLRHGLGGLIHRSAEQLTRREIADAIFSIAETAPAHANRILAYVKAMFGWAVNHGQLSANPAASIAKPSRESPRERAPTLEELANIWKAAEMLGYPFGPLVQLLMLTGARAGEVAGMRQDELVLPAGSDRGVWTIPASRSKNGRAIRVPLSPLARRAVQDALDGRRIDCAWLFTTTGQGPVSGWSRAKARLDVHVSWVAGEPLEPWRFHDFRRSFATIACDELGISPIVVDRCLNHVGAATSSTVSRVYERSALFDQRKEALDRWADLLAAKLTA